MLFCGAYERNNNPEIDSIVEPSVSKNQKEIFPVWFGLERKSWERDEAMENSISELKVEFVCMCVTRKKQQFLWYIGNVNLPFKKDFKFADFLTKTSFSFALRTVLKWRKKQTKETSKLYIKQK